jgi:hypothetical protein
MVETSTAGVNPEVAAFLAGLSEARQQESATLIGLPREATGAEQALWSGGVVGFGRLHYRYASGREGDTFVLGFAARRAGLTLYLNFALMREQLDLEPLSRYKTGKGCLYLRRLDDVDIGVLRKLLRRAAAYNVEARG